MFLALWGGFVAGRITAPKLSKEPPKQIGIVNTLLSSQNATIRGKIVSIEDRTLTIINDLGVSGVVKLADNFVVDKRNIIGRNATPSADIKSISFGRSVLIALELYGQEYKVTQITYLPVFR